MHAPFCNQTYLKCTAINHHDAVPSYMLHQIVSAYLAFTAYRSPSMEELNHLLACWQLEQTILVPKTCPLMMDSWTLHDVSRHFMHGTADSLTRSSICCFSQMNSWFSMSGLTTDICLFWCACFGRLPEKLSSYKSSRQTRTSLVFALSGKVLLMFSRRLEIDSLSCSSWT